MSRKATSSAPSNIALIKYWGARDLDAAIPQNASISMTLEVCRSTTTVRLTEEAGTDVIRLRGQDGEDVTPPPSFQRRFQEHTSRLRDRLGFRGRVEAVTSNSFPSDAGIASSASGFAALAHAVSAAAEVPGSPEELSVRARLSGSGSATRSMMGGFVIWPARSEDDHGPAEQLDLDWGLRDVIALVQSGPKDVSSLDGHQRAPTSRHYAARLAALPERTQALTAALGARDFRALAEITEEEATELHLIAMSSTPPIFYWNPGTLEVIRCVRELRERHGLDCAFTMDAGANVHVICTPESEARVADEVSALPLVHGVIRDRRGDGPRPEPEHLF